MQYLKIKIDYSHSAFSDYSGTEILCGVSKRFTKMETTVIASLKRHNVASAWSPSPVQSRDVLQDIIARHWGEKKATEYMQHMKPPGKPAPSYSPYSSLRLKPKETRAALTPAPPHVPVRKASLPKDIVPHPEPVAVLRKKSHGSAGKGYSASIKTSQQPLRLREHKSVAALGRRFRNVSSETQQSRSASTGKKKSFATEILRSLTPKMANVYTASPDRSQGREGESGQEGREQGFWGWTSWF